MKVLIIIEGTYPWYRGGVSEWVYQYLMNLSEIDFVILQIATDEFQGLDPKEALYPITSNIQEFIRISPPALSADFEQDLQDWYHHVSSSIPNSSSFDTIHVTNTGFAGWLGSTISRNSGMPLLLTEHAIYWKEVAMGASALECGYQIPKNDVAKAETVQLFKDLAQFTYKHAREIITVSNVNIPEQQKLGAQKVQYIPNGIPSDWLTAEKERNDAPVIGWVGRCAEMKNPLGFFDYVNMFQELDISAKFIMLLCDANEKALQQKVIEKGRNYTDVSMVWNKPAEDYFSSFDMLLITSHNESQPLVMLEALAHKALPIGYQVGDFNNKFGLAFEEKVPIKEQAMEISRVWKASDQFEELVNEKFALIQQEHTWNQIFEQYRQLLTEMSQKQKAHHFE